VLLLFAAVCQGGGIILLSGRPSSLVNFLLGLEEEQHTSHSQAIISFIENIK